MTTLALILVAIVIGLAFFSMTRVKRLKAVEARAALHAQRQSSLAELSLLAQSPESFHALIEKAPTVVKASLNADFVGFFETNPDKDDTVIMTSGAGWIGGYVGGKFKRSFPLSVKEMTPIYDLRMETPATERTLFGNHEVESGLCVPVPLFQSAQPDSHAARAVLGIFSRTTREFTPDEIEYTRAVAQILGSGTEIKRLDSEIKEMQRVLDVLGQSSQFGWAVLDRMDRVDRWSPAMERISGISRDEVLQQPMPSSLLSADRNSLIRKDGTSVPVSASIHRISIDGDQAMVGVITVQDLTTLRELERQLARTFREREQLLAALSMQLKAPLTAVDLNSNLLKKILSSSSDQQIRRSARHAETIQISAERMSRLIQDLRDLSQLQNGQLKLKQETVDPDGMVQRLLQTYQSVAEGKSLWLKGESQAKGTQVKGDSERVFQALSNVVENAIRYSPEGTSIRISAEHHGAGVRFTVKDTGTGIASEQLPKLFDQFWQADESRLQRHGSGLGLPLTKAIVEAHGGNLSVESKPGAGSTFYLYFPLQPVDVKPMTVNLDMGAAAKPRQTAGGGASGGSSG